MAPEPGRRRLSRWYGASAVHLVVMIATLTLAGYVLRTVGLRALWDPDVWWQSIVVWFAGAVVVHDLVLFPAYALADRLLVRALRAPRPGRRRGQVPLLNHVRVPLLAVALLFALFFPGILEQGASSYRNATGQTQEPFLQRWLVLSAAILATSACVYAIRVALRTRKHSKSMSHPR